MTEPTPAPAAALRRIAFLLERGREPTYKVRAFRRAAAAVDATDPDTLGRLAAAPGAGLRDLPGIGEVTERVIREALAGEVPVYLRRLEAIEGQPVPEGAACARDVHQRRSAPPVMYANRCRYIGRSSASHWPPWPDAPSAGKISNGGSERPGGGSQSGPGTATPACRSPER